MLKIVLREAPVGSEVIALGSRLAEKRSLL